MESYELIKNFGLRLGIELVQSDTGVYTFEVDGRNFVIHDLPEHNQVVIFGELGAVPPGNNEKLYRSLFEAQHMFASTAGATFSINPETESFFICKYFITTALDNDIFFTEIENFINILHTWADIIANYREDVTPITDEPSIFNNDGFITV